MDISSFVLGMCSVVVVGSLIVTVHSLIKIKKNIDDINNNLQVCQNAIDKLFVELNIGLENERGITVKDIDEIYRSMDSRLDKIMSKIKMLEADVYYKKQKAPNIPPGPIDMPVYPGYDYDMIRCTDNTSNQ